MTDRYVRSLATGLNNGTSWTDAYTTLSASLAAGVAGDTHYVSDDHNESTAASITLGSKGSPSTPTRIVCVNHLGSVPPVVADLRNTANVATTGASSISLTGQCFTYGINFTCGNGTSASNLMMGSDGTSQTYEECSFTLGGTGNSRFELGEGRCWMRYINCTFGFNSVNQYFYHNGFVEFIGPSGKSLISSATVPNNLVQFNSTRPPFTMTGVDLSALVSGKTLIGTGLFANKPDVKLVNCKLDPTASLSGGLQSYGPSIILIGCNSVGQVERNEIYSWTGTLTTETTIVRSGGATDGSTPYSWKIVPGGGCEHDFPFETFEGFVECLTTGASKTLSVHIVNDGLTLTNADIWVEVDYLGSSGSPVSTRVSSGIATVLGTPANVPADAGATWTTTGLTTPVEQVLQVNFTPQLVGLVRWRVKYSRTSGNVYVCPRAELS